MTTQQTTQSTQGLACTAAICDTVGYTRGTSQSGDQCSCLPRGVAASAGGRLMASSPVLLPLPLPLSAATAISALRLFTLMVPDLPVPRSLALLPPPCSVNSSRIIQSVCSSCRATHHQQAPTVRMLELTRTWPSSAELPLSWARARRAAFAAARAAAACLKRTFATSVDDRQWCKMCTAGLAGQPLSHQFWYVEQYCPLGGPNN
jgi:hypothetical protein